MKILVTGGAGYIGSHTIVELLSEGYEVVALDNLSNSNEEAIKRVEKLTNKKITFYQGDVRDRKLLDDIFNSHKIDWVIHFAGLKAVGESCQKPIEYYDNNIGSTLALVEAMQKHNVKKLIFSSSATVYGVPKTLPITEECEIGETTNPYGTSKVMQERILTDLSKSDNEWTVVLLRYFNPVGAHPSGLIGEDPKGVPNNLMPYIAQVASGRYDQITIHGNDYPTPDGTGVRDFVHVVDLAKGHTAAIKNIKGSGVYIYNLGSGRGYSVLNLITAFSKACGKELKYQIEARRPGDIAACYASCEKAKKELGWTAQYTLDDICRDQWNWQKNNPNGYEG